VRAALCIAIGLALATTGCKQIFGLDSPTQLDGGSGPVVTIGFGSPTTLADEASGVLSIPVLLTSPTDREVSVAFRILGGTATDGEDYTIAQDLIVIGPGEQSATLDIEIAADQVLEEDETLEIALENPRNATLGLAQNTVTISATVLPRVNFVATSSVVLENTTRQSLMMTLDTASTIPINVMIGTSGTAASAADFDLVATPVTFAPGTTTQVVEIDVKHDTLDEDDETVIVTLLAADAAIVGTMPTHTLTITDNDSPPTVSAVTPNSMIVEADVPITIMVQLNTPSGKDVTVPFMAMGSASAGSDYTYGTTSPLVIPAGTTSATITVNVMDDTLDESNETLTTTLGAPTNAQLGTMTHVLTITDNDVYCVGPTASAFQVCYDSGPTANVNVSSNLDTTTSVQCAATQPIGWTTTAGQPAACVIWGVDVTIDNVTASGSRPLVIAASGSITVMNGLNGSSVRSPSRNGPGAPSALCAAFASTPQGSTLGAGGGAGGSFMTIGGPGGDGVTGANGGSPAAANAATPTVLRAGCAGQRGGPDGANMAPTPGLAGGAMYLVAGVEITLQSGSRVNASGSGANGTTIEDVGGGGGGTGGMIRLYAPTITATGATLLANGGGGGEGATTGGSAPGDDPNPSTPTTPAAGGAGFAGGGNGGSGFAGSTNAGPGLNGGNGGGGGGGGGGGLIQSNLALTGATVSAGSIVIP